MWCFDKTCVLTNTAISRGDSCVILRFWTELQSIFFKNHKELDLLYGLLNYLYDKTYEIESNGEYQWEDESYRKWADIKMKHANTILKDYQFFHWTYNDYWFIKEKEEKESSFESKENEIIMHTFALETLYGKNIKELLIEIESDKISCPAWFLLKFIRLCFENRINIFWKNLLGEQHTWVDEMESQLLLLKETEKFLKNKISFYKENMED